MKLATIIAALAVVIATAAHAEPQTRFYDSRGNSIGTAVPQGEGSVRYYDAQGRSLGTSTTNSTGTTTFYGPSGNVTGRAVAPVPTVYQFREFTAAGKAPYVSAKFGLVGLSRVAALEYAAMGSRDNGGVTVNCICPGWTETAIIEPQISARAAEIGGDRNTAISSLLAEKQPSGRTSRPEEIGSLALWLAHPTAHNITGAAIPIDGGWTAQ